MLEFFIKDSYGTIENYKRSYGGAVKVKKTKFKKSGKLAITMNRDIVYPRPLIAKYDPTYVERVPPLKPTDEEIAQIRKEFEDQQEAFQQQLEIQAEMEAIAQSIYEACLEAAEKAQEEAAKAAS